MISQKEMYFNYPEEITFTTNSAQLHFGLPGWATDKP